MKIVTIKEKDGIGMKISAYQKSDKEAKSFVAEEKKRLGEDFINAVIS